MIARCAAVIAALFASACSDVDLTGVYRVDTDVESSPCGTDAPIMNPPVALKFSKGEFLGVDYFSYQECSDLAGTMCVGGGLFGMPFDNETDDGWDHTSEETLSSGSNCTITYTERSATLHGTALVIESDEWSADVENTPSVCSTDEAKRRNKSMTCQDHLHIEATKQ